METLVASLPGSDENDETAAAAATSSEAGNEKRLIKCEVCGRTMNSEKQAEAHYSGLFHIAQLQHMGLPLPSNTDLEKLKEFVTKRSKVQGVKQANRNRNWNHRGQIPLGLRTQSSSLNPISTNSAAPKYMLLCEMCCVSMNSSSQAKAHYTGKKHTSKLVELGAAENNPSRENIPSTRTTSASDARSGPSIQFNPNGSLGYPVTCSQYASCPAWMQYQNQNVNMNNSSFHVRTRHTSQAVSRTFIPCDVCQQLFNSQAQAFAHFNGSQHQKKLKMVSFYKKNVGKILNVIPATSENKYVCSVCQLSVNSDKQMVAHLAGKLHKLKLQRSGTSQEATSVKEALTSMPQEEVGPDSGHLIQPVNGSLVGL